MSIATYQLNVTSNGPQGSDYMDATAGATYLVTELQTLKADMRGQSLNKTWISLLGLQGIWTGNLAWTVISGTQAGIQGDQTVATGTGYIRVGNRVQAMVTAGTIYGTITAAVAGGGITTVTFAWDGAGALDSGLSDIQLALDLSKVTAGAINYALITNGGSGHAFTGTLTTSIAAYVQGAEYTLKWTQGSQGSDTVALNGLGAIAVYKMTSGALTPLALGDVPAGGITNAIYDSTVPSLQIVGAVGMGKSQRIIKPTNQNVASSTVLTNDSALSFVVATNEIWFFDIVVDAVIGAGGMVIAITSPCPIYYGFIPGVLTGSSASGTGLTVSTGVASSPAIFRVFGLVTALSSPGTIQFQFAQNTSNAANTTVQANSMILATRMSP